MNYEKRLVAAAKIALSADTRQNELHVDTSELGIKAILKPHQMEGVLWLIRRYIVGVNVVLGDEMGLGKTLQAICLLSYMKVQKISDGPFLVVCPLSVLDGWSHEFSNFAPKLKVLRYLGGKEERRGIRRQLYEDVKERSLSDVAFNVLLTTYDIALIDQDFLSQFPWKFSVMDEAQRLKNSASVLYNVLKRKYIMPRRLLMTGTPIQNNLTELWALMHFCMPSVFGELEQFLSTFKEDVKSSSGCYATKAKEQLKTIKYILRAFMLRRTKAKLIESGTLVLPLLTEITVMVPLVALQKKIYMSILRKELPHLLAFSTGAYSPQSLQNIVIQLRKVCSHPYMFPGIEPEPYEEGEHLVQASGKLVILDKLLHNLHGTGHRVLLFAQMTYTLDILQDFMELRGYSYERLDGSVRAEERFAAIRSFNRAFSEEDSGFSSGQGNAFVFLISTRAGGVGLNLVAADTVIFFEQDWNPQADKQALQRAHRIGQSNHVLSINLLSERTIEEVIMRRAEKKLQLSHDILGDDSYSVTELAGNAENLRTIIYGLHIFDPSELNGQSDGLDSSKLDAMVQNITAVRKKDYSSQDLWQFEINLESSLHPQNIIDASPGTVHFEPAVDEASYSLWVNKFKEASKSIEVAVPGSGTTRRLPREKQDIVEAPRNKTDEKKLKNWEALGYTSLSVKVPTTSTGYDVSTNLGSVNFVYGDCTYPSKICSSEPTIIFSCVDDSGTWGRGGMFDALARLSSSIPEAYCRASEFSDLHLGDVHLINVTKDSDNPQCVVALAVVQSYNRRRKVPRSNLSLPDLETCLLKASFSAAQNSASIHMPRIGYRESSDRSEWYTVERLLRKHSSLYGIRIFVYYYCRS